MLTTRQCDMLCRYAMSIGFTIRSRDATNNGSIVFGINQPAFNVVATFFNMQAMRPVISTSTQVRGVLNINQTAAYRDALSQVVKLNTRLQKMIEV